MLRGTVQITITEALAELKTNLKKVQKKQEFILRYIAREERVRDPLLADGGSVQAIEREQQSILDLLQRNIKIRAEIQEVNLHTPLTINGKTLSVAEWLIWKRDIAQLEKQNISSMTGRIAVVRNEASNRKVQMISATAVASGTVQPSENDILVNISEADLQKDAEDFEQTFGELDGKLSLLNATTFITL